MKTLDQRKIPIGEYFTLNTNDGIYDTEGFTTAEYLDWLEILDSDVIIRLCLRDTEVFKALLK